MQTEKIIAKTLFPISTVIIGILYFLLLWYVFSASEKISGAIFYTLVFSYMFGVLWKFRCLYEGRLILTDKHLIVRYILPTLPKRKYELGKIKNNININRIILNELTNLPDQNDYMNLFWYFEIEKYQISFDYADNEKVSFIIQPNIIRFKAFLKQWGHTINENIDNTDNNRGIKNIIVGLLLLDEISDE